MTKQEKHDKLLSALKEIKKIVEPEQAKYIMSKWGMIYGILEQLRIIHNIKI